ncbi:MAG TPA: hypothetical protein RMG48_21995 [Myxococcales bacterium LLY-WYZ-16_1]|nr:hypothetical protein [Myxococcales bacterium LLY-WYZ-16_1]
MAQQDNESGNKATRRSPKHPDRPIIRRRQGLAPGEARTASQQVKVSERDRALIEQLARLDRVTPSTWCYHVIMEAVEAQKHRVAAVRTGSRSDDGSRLAGETPAGPGRSPRTAPRAASEAGSAATGCSA